MQYGMQNGIQNGMQDGMQELVSRAEQSRAGSRRPCCNIPPTPMQSMRCDAMRCDDHRGDERTDEIGDCSVVELSGVEWYERTRRSG